MAIRTTIRTTAHPHRNKVKQSPLIDRGQIVFVKVCCFVNRTKKLRRTNFWSGRNDFELGRNDFELGRNDFELGRNDLGRNGPGAKRP